jgi:hypothetical protein
MGAHKLLAIENTLKENNGLKKIFIECATKGASSALEEDT